MALIAGWEIGNMSRNSLAGTILLSLDHRHVEQERIPYSAFPIAQSDSDACTFLATD